MAALYWTYRNDLARRRDYRPGSRDVLVRGLYWGTIETPSDAYQSSAAYAWGDEMEERRPERCDIQFGMRIIKAGREGGGGERTWVALSEPPRGTVTSVRAEVGPVSGLALQVKKAKPILVRLGSDDHALCPLCFRTCHRNLGLAASAQALISSRHPAHRPKSHREPALRRASPTHFAPGARAF